MEHFHQVGRMDHPIVPQIVIAHRSNQSLNTLKVLRTLFKGRTKIPTTIASKTDQSKANSKRARSKGTISIKIFTHLRTQIFQEIYCRFANSMSNKKIRALVTTNSRISRRSCRLFRINRTKFLLTTGLISSLTQT